MLSTELRLPEDALVLAGIAIFAAGNYGLPRVGYQAISPQVSIVGILTVFVGIAFLLLHDRS